MSEQVHYITNEQGERVGVLLDLDAYNRLANPLALDEECLIAQQTVPLFHPHRQVWEEHFTWSEDGTELVGLTPVGRATIAALNMNRPQLIRVRRMWVKVGEHPPKFE